MVGTSPLIAEFEHAGRQVRLALPSESDHISARILASKSFYELSFLQALEALVKPGDLVLDVGANIGNHTVYFAAIAGCRVMSFEPVASTCAFLRQNVQLNGIDDRVQVLEIALGECAGDATVASFDAANLGATRLSLDVAGDIRIDTVDHLQTEGPIRLIKIDAEGMDAAVVAGASETLARDRPIIACEAATPDEYRRLCDLLEAQGYVSVACFNATDTFVFMPASTEDERRSLTRYGFGEIIALQRGARALDGRFAQMGRYAERLAREGQQAVRQTLLKELEHAHGRQLDQILVQLKDLGLELQGTKGHLASVLVAREEEAGQAFKQLREAQAQLDSTRTALEAARQTQRKSETDLAALRARLGSELLEKQRWQQVAATASTSARSAARLVETYSRSITFQVGSAVQASLRSATGMFKLPVRMFRIAREKARRRAAPHEMPSDWRIVVPVQAAALPESSAYMAPVASPSLSSAVATAVDSAIIPARVPTSDAPASLIGHVPRLPMMPRQVGDLRLAVIMDEFTFSSYSPCCSVEQLLPSTWRQQLDTSVPHILFIESAWQGKDGAWQGKVVHSSPELEGILEWCRERRIPTVFWNKEDPVHFETFVGFAQRFDYVFTTDIDCIGRYKAALGHDRIFLLPFACQPLNHNPIEKYERKNAFCFAGAYYARYPQRQRDFDVFIDTLSVMAPVEIFDRNHGKDHPDYMFPERYRELILGNLAFDQIDLAYKGYQYAINLNSVKQSQTMFARRAFDLLGCNTLTVSNYSRGLRLMLGDLVVTTDSGSELLRRLQNLLGPSNISRYRKFRLAGLRKVLDEHTYADRLAYVLTKVSGFPCEKRMPFVRVVACISTDAQARRVVEAFLRQSYERKKLVLVVMDGYMPHITPDQPEISLLGEMQAAAFVPAAAWPGDFVACFSSHDYYGPNYLTDLALATLYSDAAVIGKKSYYTVGEAGLTLLDDGAQYKACRGLSMRRSIASASTFAESLTECFDLAAGTTLQASAFAIDEFNYVADAQQDSWPEVDDLSALDVGLPLSELLQRAEAINPQTYEPPAGTPVLTGGQVADVFAAPRRNGAVSLVMDEVGLVVTSSLSHDKHQYVYAKRLLPLQGWEADGKVTFHLDMEPGVSVELTLLYLDAAGEKVGSLVKHACRNVTAPVPEGATQVRLALRVKGAGEARINRLVMGPLPSHSSLELGRADHLLITNQYPSDEQLYRNAFVHRRVKGYRDRGLRTDVFCLRDVAATTHREFENVDVTVGGGDQLRAKLRGNPYRSVLVHFLDRAIWNVLKDVVNDVRVLVWVHGSDIQHWRRRDFIYGTDAERDRAKVQSDERMAFWREVLEHQHPNLHIVFVSRYLAETAMEDLGVQLAPEQFSIVHNFIDGELFDYQPKDPEQRWKILSIRPYASLIYANDLSVRMILALRNEPEFKRMEFRLIGDGPLFDATLEPLQGLPNVVVERGFLPQAEIARLHKEYGIFLVPTRMDSQGVSRDEAMASGLVPLTNTVAAVPEFVDDQCALLAPGEDVNVMAERLLELVRAPEKFQSMSRAAAARVRKQCGADQTLSREAELIRRSPFDH